MNKRGSKESIFSGLNNLRVHTILSPKFSDDFTKEALNQIYEKKYDEEMKSLGIKDIMKVGISFFGKECELIYKS